MHVLVEERQSVEVVVRRLLQRAQRPLEDLGDVRPHLGDRDQRQIPAEAVGDARRVVEIVRARDRGGVTAAAAQDPELLEIAHMADLPERRVHDGQSRAEPRFALQIGREEQRPRARVLERRGDLRPSVSFAHGPKIPLLFLAEVAREASRAAACRRKRRVAAPAPLLAPEEPRSLVI